ncbi:hypothetical protein BS50DRAFT_622865 [Corynespora cassiicola Philippines]|uniref:MI domain-containing protein n=1 Tax=Corynespora cassiicola Philippines TaxID=1448308 RepID=A0A2T2NFP8_CORCC|nr:hypothetical protein BS50DRAFT_622865 [Corynespora cassiicola Philippines]
MRQRQFTGPKLPRELRDQVGDPANRSKGGRAHSGPLNRRERRQAEREDKKAQKSQKPLKNHRGIHNEQERYLSEPDWEDEESADESQLAPPKPTPTANDAQKPVKSILKKVAPVKQPPEGGDVPPPARISRAVKDRLAEEDAEIAALEKRLGIKGKKKSKNVDNELDDIFGDLGDFGSDEDELSGRTSKRKRDQDDEWLASKRQKALGDSKHDSEEDLSDLEGLDDAESDLDEQDLEDMEDVSSEDEMGSDNEVDEDDSAMEDLDSERDDNKRVFTKPRVRENPYVAPVTSDTPQPAKYIPPALRAPPSSDSEALARLRRQIQGLLNRLSDANLLTILRDVEQIYQNNPRGYVTTTLVDLLFGLLADETALLDTFLILHSGFIAAIYKVIGPDFGAQMVERIVSEFDKNYQRNKDGFGKQTTNMMSVVAQLYSFQVIGSNLVFDYIKMFLAELSEINTELLLRIVRISGSQLRQDDPTSLKDIVLLLQKAVANVGEKNLPVRTKFMIETINDLKNNKMKTGVNASAITSEHTIRMKKHLGSLNSRNLKGTEPLRIGLADIQNTEKKGKWWLVGASWRNDTENGTATNKSRDADQEVMLGHEDTGENGEVDLLQLAREQRMNTDVRRAIFITIMSASDFKDAHVRLLKLNLKKSQEMEIPRVIVHCAGCEANYNPYYTLLARKFCSDHRSRKCFQFTLWDIFKGLGEKKEEGADSDDEDHSKEDMSLRRLVNLGKLYGTLIAKDGLSITSLKPLNFPYLQPKTKTLIEILLVTVILESQKGSKQAQKGARSEKALLNIFINADSALEMVTGLQYFLKKVVSRTTITASKTEKDTVQWGCRVVRDMLTRLMATTTLDEEE